MGHGSTFAEGIAKIKVTYLFLGIRVLFFKKSLALSSLARSSAHMSAERSGNGAERAENGVSGSGAVSGHSRKRLSVRLSVERDRGRRAESGCHKNRPLTCSVGLAERGADVIYVDFSNEVDSLGAYL